MVERRPAPKGEARSRPTPTPPSRAVLAIWATLAGLALARAALAYPRSMWLWGLDAQRFLAPLSAWLPWALSALALLPPVGRRLSPGLARLGDAIGRRPLASAIGWAAFAAVLAWVLPDRVHFTGDFQLRLGALEAEDVAVADWTPVALPLDLALHESLMHWLHGAFGVEWNTASRILGAAEAAMLGALATGFPRVLGLGGATAAAGAAIVLFGGSLTLFTGYGKSLVELVVLTAAVGISGLARVRSGRGAVVLGLAAAAGFALHRSSLALLVGMAAAHLLARRGVEPEAAPGGREARRGSTAGRAPSRRAAAPGRARAAALPALVLPLAVLAAMAPRILEAMRRYDGGHLAPAGTLADLVTAAFAPRHLLDIANVVLQLAPLALVAPVLLVLDRSSRLRERVFLLCLLAPYAAALLFIHPHQGMFRDLDDFAAAGMALSLLTAWLVARALDAAPGRSWLAPAVVLGVAAPAVQWMLLSSDLERGLARVHAFTHGPPQRSDDELARTWDYLGVRYIKLQRWSEGARVLEQAARIGPSPRILRQWATCEARLGHLREGHALYGRALAGNPEDYPGWREYAASSMLLGERGEARRAAHEMLRLAPGDSDAMRVLSDLGAPGPADSAGAAGVRR